MDIKIRLFEEKDWPEMAIWFRIPPPEDVRGNFGLVAHRGEKNLAVGFLIPTAANFCLWEFVQTDEKAPLFSNAKAVKLLTEAAIKLAKELGYKAILGFTPVKSKSLLKFYKSINAFIDETDFKLVVRRF